MSVAPLSRAIATSTLAPSKRRQGVGFTAFAFIAVCVFMAVGAFNGQNNLLMWMFAATVGVLLLGGVISASGLMGVRASMRAPLHATAGEPFEIEITLENRGPIPAFGLQIEIDGVGGATLIGPGAVEIVRRGEPVRARLRCFTAQRGQLKLTKLRVFSVFPLGVARKTLEFDTGASVLVRPARLAIRTDALANARGRGGHSHSNAARLGAGDEFFGLREYSPGDPLRMIAWKRSGAGRGYLVRQNAESGARRVWIELDLPEQESKAETGATAWKDALLADPTELTIAIAAAVCKHSSDRERAFGLTLRDRGVLVMPGTGRLQLASVLDRLATLDPAQVRTGSWIGGQFDEVVRIGPGASGAFAFDTSRPEKYLQGDHR